MSSARTHPEGRGLPTRLLLLSTLLLALVLRLALLGHQELRGDEAFGYFFSRAPYATIVERTVELAEPHPVASYFVEHAWLQWAGESEFSLRFGSVWFGVLAVGLIYRLARKLLPSRQNAWLAALLLALSPYAIWHSQDARMYSMSLALTMATVWLALEALQRRRMPWIVAYIAAAWLALHTHYFAFFILVGLTLFVLGRAVTTPAARPAMADWIVWNLVVAACYAPWLLRVEQILTGYDGNGDSPGFIAMLRRSLSVLAVGESTANAERIWWALLAAALMALGAWQLWRSGANGRRSLWLLTCYLGAPLLLTWYGARQRPIFNERYLVAATPALLLLCAEALGSLPNRWPRRWNGLTSAAAMLLTLMLLGMGGSLLRHYSDPAYSKTRGWRELAAAFQRLSSGLPTDQVRLVQNYPDPTLWYYYRGAVQHLVLPPAAFDGAGAEREVAALADDGVQRVILIDQPSPTWDDGSLARAALATRFAPALESSVAAWPVVIFARALEESGQVRGKPLAEFENGLTLTAVSIAPTQTLPAGVVTVQLGWAGLAERLSGSEKVSVQLLNGAGQVVAQDDDPLPVSGLTPAQSSVATYGILEPSDVAPGVQQLIVVVYDPGQAGAPRIRTTQRQDAVVIGAVTVGR